MWIYVSVCSVAPCDVASISTLDFIRLGVNILPVRQRGFHLWPACSHSPDSKQKHTGPLGKVREVLASTKHLMKEGEKSFINCTGYCCRLYLPSLNPFKNLGCKRFPSVTYQPQI